VQGVQMSAPFGRYSAAAEVLEAVLPRRARKNAAGAVVPEASRVGQL